MPLALDDDPFSLAATGVPQYPKKGPGSRGSRPDASVKPREAGGSGAGSCLCCSFFLTAACLVAYCVRYGPPPALLAKAQLMRSALDGDLQRENLRLRSALAQAGAKGKEADSRIAALQRQEAAAAQQREAARREATKAEAEAEAERRKATEAISKAGTLQQDLARTRKELQNLHQKSSFLQLSLTDAQQQAAEDAKQMRFWQDKVSAALRERGQAQQALASSEGRLRAAEAEGEALRKELHEEEEWRELSEEKLRQFKSAELHLVQSWDLDVGGRKRSR